MSCTCRDPNASRNADINRFLKAEEDAHRTDISILVLGTAECGKTTFVKQMKIIHQGGYSEAERRVWIPKIHRNVIQTLRTLIAGCEIHDLKIDDKFKPIVEELEEMRAIETPEIGERLLSLWHSESIQKAFEKRSELQIIDSAKYYLDDLARLSDPDFAPTPQDVVRCRVATIGIQESSFPYSDANVILTDVGGQRNERRKWIHCFEDSKALIFVGSLSEYDMKLMEDKVTNRMKESLQLFEAIVNSKWFANTPVILFLNKKDVFEEKIKRVPLNVCFKSYSGPNDETAAKYIEERFVKLNKNPKRQIYPKLTTATDTENITTVFKSIMQILMSAEADAMGF